MTTHADFTGIPFIAGSIIGERAFTLVGDYQLKSPLKPYVWETGDNLAKCLKADTTLANKLTSRRGWPQAYETAKQFVPDHARVARVYVTGYSFWTTTGNSSFVIEWYRPTSGARGTERVSRETFMAALWEQHGHNFGTCSCGFYAYLNGYNEYADSGCVGVIEGFGDTFIGDRGFRTSKARIIALALDGDHYSRRTVAQFRDRYPSIPLYTDAAQMKREFPPTNVEEVLSLRDEADES